jgi:DNA-directed RNA polymerase subunit RPC12/RpoP
MEKTCSNCSKIFIIDHSARRYCPECSDKVRKNYLKQYGKKYSKQYYLNNQDKLKLSSKEYHLRNIDKIKEKRKEYRLRSQKLYSSYDFSSSNKNMYNLYLFTNILI